MDKLTYILLAISLCFCASNYSYEINYLQAQKMKLDSCFKIKHEVIDSVLLDCEKTINHLDSTTINDYSLSAKQLSFYEKKQIFYDLFDEKSNRINQINNLQSDLLNGIIKTKQAKKYINKEDSLSKVFLHYVSEFEFNLQHQINEYKKLKLQLDSIVNK